MVQQNSKPCFLADSRGTALAVNQAWRDICKYADEDIIGKNMRILQGVDTKRDQVEEMMAQAPEDEAVKAAVGQLMKEIAEMKADAETGSGAEMKKEMGELKAQIVQLMQLMPQQGAAQAP